MRKWLSAMLRLPPEDPGLYGRGAPAALGLLRAAAALAFQGRLRRRLKAEVTVRRLGPADVDALLAFADANLRFPTWFLHRQLLGRWQAEGAAAGAVDAQGRLWGFAYLDRYTEEDLRLDGWWIRALMVDPRARRLGLAGRLVAHLCEHARAQRLDAVLADVREDNARSLRLFRRCGFLPAEPGCEARARAVLEAARPQARWVVLERRLEGRSEVSG
jgi:mycothiol synthase